MFLNLVDLLAALSLQCVSAVIFPMATGTIIQQLDFGSVWLSTWNGEQASKCVWEAAVIVARAAGNLQLSPIS